MARKNLFLLSIMELRIWEEFKKQCHGKTIDDGRQILASLTNQKINLSYLDYYSKVGYLVKKNLLPEGFIAKSEKRERISARKKIEQKMGKPFLDVLRGLKSHIDPDEQLFDLSGVSISMGTILYELKKERDNISENDWFFSLIKKKRQKKQEQPTTKSAEKSEPAPSQSFPIQMECTKCGHRQSGGSISPFDAFGRNLMLGLRGSRCDKCSSWGSMRAKTVAYGKVVHKEIRDGDEIFVDAEGNKTSNPLLQLAPDKEHAEQVTQ